MLFVVATANQPPKEVRNQLRTQHYSAPMLFSSPTSSSHTPLAVLTTVAVDEDYQGSEPVPVVHSTGDGDGDGEVRNLAVKVNKEKFKATLEERILKPFQSLTVLGNEFITIDAKVDTLEEKLNNQPAELKKELKAELNRGFKREQARLKDEPTNQIREELKKELKGELDKDLAEFNYFLSLRASK